MDIRQLSYFLAVAEEGLVTKAAERLHITQSPLSQQMITLEKEMGVKLFQRTKKHIGLTPAGQVLKRRAEQILDMAHSTVNEVRETGEGICGKLTIGIIHSSGRLLLPERIQLFHEQYPRVSFDLRQGDPEHILELMRLRLVDLGFVRLPVDTELYELIPIPTEEIVILMRPSYAKDTGTQMSLLEVGDAPLLLHRRYERLVREYFESHHRGPNILCVSDELIPLLTWADCGLGVAVVPQFASHFAMDDLCVKELSEPVLRTSSTLIWRKGEDLSMAAKHFIELFREEEMMKKKDSGQGKAAVMTKA
jgi:DNA-binding transcriptional LysR family regulator